MALAYVYEDDAAGWRVLTGSDLPNSGAAPATYGDASHVPQIAVNAQGLITSASNVAIAGGGAISTIDSPGSSISVTNPAGPTVSLDLPNSGVGAGTYGDATHVAAVTVNARGVVTGVSLVAIGGSSGGTGFALIGSQTLGVNAASMGVSGIPGTYSHLDVVMMCRAAAGALPTYCVIQFNADTTAANYQSEIEGAVGAATQFQTLLTANNGISAQIEVGGSLANSFAPIRFAVPLYAAAVNKNVTGTAARFGDGSGGSNPLSASFSGLWKSTAAITSITVAVQGGANLVAGSSISVYGMS